MVCAPTIRSAAIDTYEESCMRSSIVALSLFGSLALIRPAVAENGSLIGFITSAISTSIGNVPIATTSGGVTFRFEGGIPVKTSLSSGPIFAERAQTLGRGRAAVGIGHTAFQFTSLRGVPTDNISL